MRFIKLVATAGWLALSACGSDGNARNDLGSEDRGDASSVAADSLAARRAACEFASGARVSESLGIDEPTRQHYAALYARPHAMHDAFEQFVAFPEDAVDNQALLAKGKLTMPVLAIGGSASYGASLAVELGYVATDVKSVVIENSGHWLMEEQPAATMAAITAFLKS